MTEVIVAEDLRKRYGDVDALAGVSLSVRAGEVFALIGPNGAGKTTLVRALTGTTTPTDGSVAVFGSDPTAVDRSRIGVLPQDFSPPGRLTARELMDYYAGLYDDAADPESVLATVGLADAGETWYENLSGGQQRRACLGAALVNEPELLFLDEPTTGIDPAGRRTVAERVEALAAGGTTVLLTTHDMAEAERLADRVGLLAGGELVAVGTPERLVDEHGGQPRLRVDLDPEATGDSADSEALAAALTDDGFESTATPRGVEITGVDPTEIGAAVEALELRNVAYDSLAWSEPTLEDVYMELAGAVEGAAAGPETSPRWPAPGSAEGTARETGGAAGVGHEPAEAETADDAESTTTSGGERL